jgi:hypothetical protein
LVSERGEAQMIGTVSEWVAREVDQAPNEVMASAVLTVAATADDPSLSDAIRTEARRAVEDIVRGWYETADAKPVLTREAWLEMFDAITEQAEEFPYTREDFGAEVDRWTAADRHVCKGNFVRVFRLVLARLNSDDDARQMLIDELADCPQCWQMVAQHLVTMFTNSLVCNGREFGVVVEWVEGAIMAGVDSMEADERTDR